MAVITPQTDVYLLKVPLEIDEMNQLTFANTTAQYNYFNSLPKLSVDNFTYQRKDGTIRYGAKFDDLINYNYVMYRNDGYSNKWFYAFITGLEYLNDNVTAIAIKTDVWQTWQFDLTYKRTFIEREHVNDDTIGKHTVPEGLDLGEYEIESLINAPLWETNTPSTDFLPCFCVTKLPSATTQTTNGRVKNDAGYIGGVFSSLKFFACQTLDAAQHIIDIYDNDSSLTSDAIVNIYMIPSCCVNRTDNSPSTIQGYSLYPIYNYYQSDPVTFYDPHKLAENYTPKNNKLLTAPFSYFYISNNAGEEVQLKYEDFPLTNVPNVGQRRTITYYREIVPSTSLSAKLYFKSYKSYTEGATYGEHLYTYGINYGKVPVCAWTTDYYTNWLTQNGVSAGLGMGLSILGGAVGMAGSIATGNIAGIAMSGIGIEQSITNTLREVQKAETTPPQAHGNTNAGDFNFCFLKDSMSIYLMSIRPEYASMIDNYFSMFGYKVNEVKTPNITGRRNWNFVKTNGCYIEANIPQDDLQEIKNMFDKGITFWHNTTTFMDYSQNNDII